MLWVLMYAYGLCFFRGIVPTRHRVTKTCMVTNNCVADKLPPVAWHSVILDIATRRIHDRHLIPLHQEDMVPDPRPRPLPDHGEYIDPFLPYLTRNPVLQNQS